MKRPSLSSMLTALLVLVPLACSGGQKPAIEKAEAVDPGDSLAQGRLFTGPEGIKAHVVELEGGEKALIKVTGSRSEVEGKVLEHRIEEDGPRLSYITTIRGRDRYTLVRTDDRHGRAARWSLYLGARYPDGVEVTYDEDAGAGADAVAIWREHQEQVRDGVLVPLQRFDRAAEEKEEEDALAEKAAAAADRCRHKFAVSVAWDTVSDDDLKSKSIESFCGAPLDVMRGMCERHDMARTFFKDKVRAVQCRIVSDRSLAIASGTLQWNQSFSAVNADQFARETLMEQPYRGKTLRYHIALSETEVCADTAEQRYIVLAPEGSGNPGLFYGDGKTFHKARTTELLGQGWFHEPRFFNPRYNSSFRGHDLRSWSKVEVDAEAGTCALACGTGNVELALLRGKAAMDIAGGMNIAPDPLPFEPYALARDRRGNYYYVERGTKPGQDRYFRLYVGRLGNMKLQKMKDIVSDSEGEIFSSKAGDLRLILDKSRDLDKSQATWITGRKTRPLKMIPISKNLQLIYNDLGVYIGARLGTPCDDYGL